ncbi:M4 family metallopeptidase [Streptomyces acidiscabies]|uniref:M4 family metallopeptidase n=1 Tax=Streptomyces acidiscabies TaxID=42234 RepID=A0AAP6BDI9_9ACTN|nr:M4 family metallopeptidase [Streptomyces acidiscabies]MBZ3917555.1 M4 family metallopeptidase [Streptomyces acidiscabies]MDX2962760.1 M4 family metallopeptidase [Streptomyces acidiscabies]MDX3018933.1 M4 family metallopeptidase [Streptomyces acidiscabies]MDX3790395.1 M4 family metallopeptidase [Streptomyces acidiscabies]GAQ54119.1 transglutaminase-activating metalloprotease [Streptomyces acidiscabies]
MRPTPRKRTTACAALLSTTALLALGVQTVPATARPAAPHPAPLRTGALPADLTPAQRTTLIKNAESKAPGTAKGLGLGAQEKLLVKDVVKDNDGTVHTRYERTYAGLPVLGGDLVVHTPPASLAAGTVSTTFNNDRRTISVKSTTPTLGKSAAETKALKTAKTVNSRAGSARKVIWAAEGTPELAWETIVTGIQKDGTPSKLHIVTDAATGAELSRWEGIETGTGNSQYSGTVTMGTTLSGSTYQLYDTARGGHKTYSLNNGTSGTGTLMTDADDVWGTGAGSNTQTAGVDAHFGAQTTWDFYKNTFGRSGIKNDGVAAYSRVHYSSAYVNAFWDDSCFCMTYGDGSGSTHALTSLDVAGHEMSHGVTSNTAGLNYTGESGGLNEATSDIFGTGVEFYANNATDVGDYLIGEKIDINGNGTPLRYMDQPSKDGASANAWYSGVGNLDVHYSSGPANHMFYLLSEGSGTKTINGVTYNSPTSDGVAVAGIGRAAALQIWYKALTTYMTSSTNYAGARTAALNAATALYGASSAQYAGVGNAFAGISVGGHITVPSTGVTVTNPGSQSSTVGTAAGLQISASSTNSGSLTYAASGLPTGLAISSTGLISGTPTTAGTYSTTVTVTDSTGATGTASFTWTVSSSGGGGTCTSMQLLSNAGFESGNTGWSAASGVITNSSGQAARTGSYKAWLDGYGSTHTDTLSQSVTVPSGCAGTTFTFYLHIDTAETTTSTQYDKLTVAAGSTTLATYSNLNAASGYVQKSFSLGSYAGSTVTLTFTGVEDSSLQTSFVVDDTAVTTG